MAPDDPVPAEPTVPPAAPAAPATPAAPAATSGPSAAPAAPAAAPVPSPAAAAPEPGAPGEPAKLEAAPPPPEPGAATGESGTKGPSSALGDAGREPAKADAEPAEGEPKADATAAEPLKYEAFTAPDGQQFNEPVIAPYTDILARHQVPQAVVQELLEAALRQQADSARSINDQFMALRESWLAEWKKAEDIGGNRYETVRGRAGALLESYGRAVGRAEENAFRDMLGVTGMGDHPSMARFLNWLSRLSVESARAVPASQAVKPTRPQSRAQNRYRTTVPTSNGAA